MKRLDAAQVERFRRDGALSPIAVLDPSDVLRFREAIDEMESLLGGSLQRIDNIHFHLRWARDLVCHAAVVDVLEDILGSEVLVHSSRIFAKQPRDGTYVNWHQDGRYSQLGTTSITAWIALTDSRPDNGCVRIVPGSHHGGPLVHRELPSALNLNHHGEEVAVRVDERDATDFVLAAGEMSLHDVYIVHSSYSNHSDRCRVGFSVTYTTPPASAANALFVRARGHAALPHLRLWSEPPCETVSDGLAAHAEWLRGNSQRAPRVRERVAS